jgi:hypothetical protein
LLRFATVWLFTGLLLRCTFGLVLVDGSLRLWFGLVQFGLVYLRLRTLVVFVVRYAFVVRFGCGGLVYSVLGSLRLPFCVVAVYVGWFGLFVSRFPGSSFVGFLAFACILVLLLRSFRLLFVGFHSSRLFLVGLRWVCFVYVPGYV